MSQTSTFEEVKHWLKSIKPGYEKFAPAFDDYGCEDMDDVKDVLDQDTLDSGLMDKLREHRAKPLHEKRITRAIRLLHNQGREADAPYQPQAETQAQAQAQAEAQAQAQAEAQAEAEDEVQVQNHEPQQAAEMINLPDEPEQEQLGDTQIRGKYRTGTINLISTLCEKNRTQITLEEIYERLGAQTNLEKNGVRYGVWASKEAGKIKCTKKCGTYEVC